MEIHEKELHLRSRIAENTRELRLALGISQENLGVQAGFHRTFVSQVERGVANLTISSIVQLAIALQVEPIDLFK